MTSHQLINQTSGDTEYYTPAFIIEAAQRVMGGIDLDPASSEVANQTVRAKTFFTREHDGLSVQWFGRVWMNHPFSRIGNPIWINKAVTEYRSNRVETLLCITFAATSEQWFQPLMDFPQCYLCPRTNYSLPDGTLKRGITKGSVVTYMGRDAVRFARSFNSFGAIKVRFNS